MSNAAACEAGLAAGVRTATELRERGIPVAVVGHVHDGPAGRITVRPHPGPT